MCLLICEGCAGWDGARGLGGGREAYLQRERVEVVCWDMSGVLCTV